MSPNDETVPPVPESAREFWQAFVAKQSSDPTSRFLEAFYFDDNESSANELGQLVLAGTKKATASLLWCYEEESKPLPRQGDLSVVTTWQGLPLCVIETRDVSIVPYDEVTEEFAATEGEGDGSLRYWREAHWAFFGRECQRLGKEPNLLMPVVCERFEVVYRNPDMEKG
jgi:uncharacterized protein YhfF